MMYSAEVIDELLIESDDLYFRINNLMLEVVAFSYKVVDPMAREYLLYGAGRRINVANRCFQNIFRIFPPTRHELLSQDDRTDVEISLHSFLINTYGVLDNLALSLAYENKIYNGTPDCDFDIRDVGLFIQKFRKRLNPDLKKFLAEPRLRAWFDDYSKNFRDALVHRVPPYIPPAGMNGKELERFNEIQAKLQQLDFATDLDEIASLQDEQVLLGHPLPIFVHSIAEGSRKVELHAQVISDLLTVEELVGKVLGSFHAPMS